MLSPKEYTFARHIQYETPLVVHIRLAGKSHRRYPLIAGEEMDVTGNRGQVGEGRSGRIWPEQMPVSRHQTRNS